MHQVMQQYFLVTYGHVTIHKQFHLISYVIVDMTVKTSLMKNLQFVKEPAKPKFMLCI